MSASNWIDPSIPNYLGEHPKIGPIDEILWYEYDGYIIALPYIKEDDDKYLWTDDKITFSDMTHLMTFVTELEKFGRTINVKDSDDVD